MNGAMPMSLTVTHRLGFPGIFYQLTSVIPTSYMAKNLIKGLGGVKLDQCMLTSFNAKTGTNSYLNCDHSSMIDVYVFSYLIVHN